MSEGISSFNPAQRRLCPDGACIGVIGDDGRCRVCGISLQAGGAAGVAAGSPAIAEPYGGDSDAAGAHDDDAGTDRDGDQAAMRATDGAFRPDRRLCDDGSCVGVLGADGLCPVCGRRAES